MLKAKLNLTYLNFLIDLNGLKIDINISPKPALDIQHKILQFL